MSIKVRPSWSQILGGQTAGRTFLGLGTAAYNNTGDFETAGAGASARAFAIQRVNHTGTQPASTITGLGSLALLNAVDLAGGTVTGTLPDGKLSANVPLLNAINSFSVAQYITNGGLNVGASSAPKGTGNQKIDVNGTGTGAAAFGSLALSRADGSSGSIAGSIDFYCITTLAAQIQCNQASGGAGGVNYLSFNLGAAGTLNAAMQLQYANASALATLLVGKTNGTLQGKLQVTNYSNGSVTTGITLSNPVSTGGTGGCGLAWVDGAGNTIGQIRGQYMSAAGVGDLVLSVGQGATNGLQDFVRFTSGGRMDFYLLDSLPANQKVGGIYPTWSNSTSATRIGAMNFTAMNVNTEVNAFTYWASSPTYCSMNINANVTFISNSLPNFTAGLQMPGTKPVIFNAVDATAGTTLTKSGTIWFYTSYWNGTASAAQIGYLFSRAANTSQGSSCLAYQCNPGSGVSDMFSAGASTTGAENSQLTLSNVIVSGGLSYNSFGVSASWLNNTPAARLSTVNFNAYYISTAQNGLQIDGVSSGNKPNISLVLGTATASYGGGKGVVFIADCGTAPSGTPAGGVVFFSDGGVLKWRDPSGTTYTVAHT